IEDDALLASLQRAFGQELADGRRGVLVRAGLAGLLQRFFLRRSGGNSLAGCIVDELSADVLRRAKHRQPQAIARRLPEARAVALSAALRGGHKGHGYFFLPSLRRMCSPAYFTPLPL